MTAVHMNYLQAAIVLAGLGLSRISNDWSMIFSGILYRFAA